MLGASGATRVTTLLFLDIVGSTDLASQLGDDRWRATLARFRRIVRGQLKAHHGHEEDTAGDGFFATFVQPASAIRCASSIAREVQSIGIDVRCGIHTGELGTVEGRPGGMAVHVSARVMALAGAAEILCTSTVRDLVLGSDIGFEERGTESLKGVPGTWDILAVTRTPEPVPVALAPEQATERLDAMPPQTDRGKRSLLVGSGVGAAVIVAVVVGLATLGGRDETNAPAATAPPALLRLDQSNRIVQTLDERPNAVNVVLGAADGTFWQEVGDHDLIGRRVEDGADTFPIKVPDLGLDPAFGFGSAWVIAPKHGSHGSPMSVTRYDERSGRPMPPPYTVPGSPMLAVYGNALNAFMAGPTGVWYLRGDDTRLSFIDPISNTARSWPTGDWGIWGPTEVLPTADAVWLCDPLDNVIKRFDVTTHKVSAPIPTVGDQACPVAVIGGSVWVLERSKGWALTEIDANTGKPLSVSSIGAGSGTIGLTSYALGSIWFPAGPVLYRFDLTSHVSTPIAMPAGVSAGTVVADEPSGTVWVANCPPSECNWVPAG